MVQSVESEEKEEECQSEGQATVGKRVKRNWTQSQAKPKGKECQCVEGFGWISHFGLGKHADYKLFSLCNSCPKENKSDRGY